MTDGILAMVRGAACFSMAVMVVAVGIGKHASEVEGRRPAPRRLIRRDGSAGRDDPQSLLVRALETGDETRLTLPTGDRLDLVTVSPWEDRWGQSQAVGRWHRRDGELLEASGMARLRVPSGAIIERIALDVLPMSPPCWSSDSSARVLYVGRDGRLHVCDFEGPREAPDGRRARVVRWGCDPPGVDEPLLYDVARPRGPLGREFVLASLAVREPGDDRRRFRASEIWWLRLDRDDSLVLDAGPITRPDPDRPPEERRRPTLISEPDGSSPRLVYHGRSTGTGEVLLRIAPLRRDRATGGVLPLRSGGRVLRDVPDIATLAVAPDGRSVFAVPDPERGVAPLRIPLGPDRRTLTSAARMIPSF